MATIKRQLGFDAQALRPTSAADSFPWLARLVTLVRVAADGTVTQAKTDAEKRRLLGQADERDLVLAAWPGEWSQDVFVVDDLSAARLALGLPRHRVKPTPVSERPAAVSSAPLTSVRSRADLWSCLAALPDLPAEGQRELADRFAGYSSSEVAVLLLRPGFDSQARERLIAKASRWVAPALISAGHTTSAEALHLVDRFADSAEVLEAALRRSDTEALVRQKMTALSYVDAVKLWEGGRAWSSEKRPEFASAVLFVVLGTEPAAEHAAKRPALIRSLAADLPTSVRLDLLRDQQYGSVARQAFLAGEELADEELAECLPEVLAPQDVVPAGSAPMLVQYLRRFPRLVGLAGDRLGAIAAQLIDAGWSPTDAARAGRWEELVTVAGIADTADLLDALVQAAVFDSDSSSRATQPWREPRRYELVDLLLANAAMSDKQLRHLLDQLPTQHIDEIQQAARKRSRVSRLCAEVLRARRPAATSTPARAAASAPELPTDEELAAAADPVAILRDLLRQRGPNRDASVAHALSSSYMTDDLAWRVAVQDLERHPMYGPRLAAKVAAICGTSPSRWKALAANSTVSHSQLLAATLFSRLEAAE